MIRVLMVDDDPRVLDGLRRSLYSMRNDRKVRFADSGVAALQQLEQEPADVVVSDMRMRGLDGTQLLAEVERLHPEAVNLTALCRMTATLVKLAPSPVCRVVGRLSEAEAVLLTLGVGAPVS